jgi:predicted ATP-binding protein involved in virulence
MKIEHLELEGFRGFESADFDFHPKMNVLIGVNGSGKTSVLDALSSGLDYLLYSIAYTNSFLPSKGKNIETLISKEDIRFHQKNATIKVDFDKGSLTLNKSYIDLKPSTNKSLDLEIQKKAEDINSYLLTERSANQLFIATFYKTDRLISSTEEQPAFDILGVLSDMFQGVAGGISSFDTFKSWYITEENKENRTKIRVDSNYINPNLKAVRTAIELFFKEINGDELFGQLYVDDVAHKNGSTASLGLYIHKKNEAIRIDSLSEGERMLILLVSDIARRLTLTSQHLDDFDALKGHGIVLIDEIELHLHPKWQRRIVLALTKVFPNIQFFLTTHSPQVLSGVPKECVHIIENFKMVKNTPPTKGRDSNSLLWDVFGVKEHPRETRELLDKFYEALDEEAQKEATNYLKQLSKQLGDDDQTVQKAKLSYEFNFE